MTLTKRDKILAPIAVVIIIVSVLIAYKGFFAEEIGIATTAAPDTKANQDTIVNLLPNGKQLDLTRLQARNKNLNINEGTVYQYPEVTEADVGIEAKNLFGQ